MIKTSFDLALEKMKQFCVYRERGHQEVRNKLIKDKIYGDDLEKIMAILIEEDFLNEERFATAFAIGKFRQNRWGKVKIKMEMKRFKISEYCERKAFEAIDEKEYLQTLSELYEKKMALLKGGERYTNKQKVIKYLLGKGYEYELIKDVVS